MLVKPDYSDRFLQYLFDGVDTQDYFWTLSQVEAFQASATTDVFNWEESDFFVLNNQEFRAAITVHDYRINFLVLMGFYYPVNDVAGIRTYQDFVKSDCELALVCVDCYHFDFYAKNADMVEKIYKNAYPLCEKSSGYITENDVSRTSFIGLR